MMIMKRTILILLLTFSLVNVVNAEGIDQDRIKGMPLINGWKLRLDDLSSFYIQRLKQNHRQKRILIEQIIYLLKENWTAKGLKAGE